MWWRYRRYRNRYRSYKTGLVNFKTVSTAVDTARVQLSNYSSYAPEDSQIMKIQRGKVSGSATIKIKEVNIAKTMIFSSFMSKASSSSSASKEAYNDHFGGWTSWMWSRAGYGYGYGYGYGKIGSTVTLISPTQIQIDATDGNTTTYYEIVEFKGDVNDTKET